MTDTISRTVTDTQISAADASAEEKPALRGTGRGALFDLDGTLIDSLPMLYEFYTDFLAARGRAGSTGEFNLLNGPSLPDVAARLKEIHGLDETVDAILKEYTAGMKGIYFERVSPRPEAAQALETFRSAGFLLALVSSNTATLINAFLRRAGWEQTFDAVITGDDVAKAKPAPDIYLAALGRLGLDGAKTVAVEDSRNGVRAAAAAGCRVIGLSYSEPSRALLEAGAHAVAGALSLAPHLAAMLLESNCTNRGDYLNILTQIEDKGE